MDVGKDVQGGEGPLEFEIWCFPIKFLAKQGCSLSFELVKWNFTIVGTTGKIFWLPLEKSNTSPLEKSFRRPCSPE